MPASTRLRHGRASSSGTSGAPAPSPTKQWHGIEGGIARSYGHCMTMGTASTMTAIAEAMGLTLPGASSIPAADANHQRMSAAMRPPHRRDGLGGSDAGPDRHPGSGAQRGDGRDGDRLLDQRRHPPHRHGAPRRRPLDLDDLDRIGRTTPVIANIRPSGTDYLMEDFFYAGGLRAPDEAARRQARPHRPSPSPASPWSTARRRRGLQRATSSAHCPTRSITKVRWPCSRATSAPMARSSSPPPAIPNSTASRGPALVADSYPE